MASFQGFADRIAKNVGRGLARKHVSVGESIRKHYGTRMGPHPGGAAYGDPTVVSVLDSIEEDLRRSLKGAGSWATGAPITRAGKWVYQGAREGRGRGTGRTIFDSSRKIAGSMGRHPGRWMAGIGLAAVPIGVGKGIRQGLSEQGYPIETRSQAPIFSFGPGYQTWAKGRGRPMSPNHLGTTGLLQALHKTRHR